MCVFAMACGIDKRNPAAPSGGLAVPGAPHAAQGDSPPSWGPETPPFNVEAQLRGEGFGLVTFRQPNDEDQIAYLDVWVRNLQPNTSYSLQRAVDTVLDDTCTGTNWLTLGHGTSPAPITTDDRGTGRAELWRDLGAFAAGTKFDIHFRVIQNDTNPLVVPLTTACHQFVISR
jgi:hypothetical protein